MDMDNIQIEPRELHERMQRGEKVLLVDVREAWERQTCRLEGAELIPMREIPTAIDRLLDAEEVILYCHRGMRSFDAAAWLRQQGVEGARSLAGGIDRWSREIDAGVPRYD